MLTLKPHVAVVFTRGGFYMKKLLHVIIILSVAGISRAGEKVVESLDRGMVVGVAMNVWGLGEREQNRRI